ncbi:hypothetical protein MKX01_001175 [Papaver californicum]|nr:hypothetical protein MKX01_001175 [Papaver californicum]
MYLNSGEIKIPTPTEMDYLGRLDFEIIRFAKEQYVIDNELEIYLREIHEFVLLEVQEKFAAKLKLDAGVEKRMVLQDGEDCSICLQGLNVGDEAVILKCSHTFHEKCMSQWLTRKPNCPLCRFDCSI